MPHFPKPFFKKARKLWYVQIDGKYINLGPDRDEAFRRYHELMVAPKQAAGSPVRDLLSIIDRYLEWVQKHRAPDTYEWYRYRLQRFVDRYPDMRVSTLKPFHLEQWVDEFSLSKTSRRNYFRSVKTCLTWAVKQGIIEKNPIAALEMPGAERKDVYITPEQFEQLLGYVRDTEFRDLLVATYNTGCRPQESLIVTAEFVDLENARWVFPQKQSKGKKAPRIIYLNEAALEITRRLIAKYPRGELFRNSQGKPWTTEATNCVIDRLQVRMGRKILDERGISPSEAEINILIKTLKPTCVRKGVKRPKTKAELREEAKRKLFQRMCKKVVPRYSLYALRHSWATNALKRGVDPLTVALLMGHKDPSMLARVYQHLSHSPEHMLEQAQKASGSLVRQVRATQAPSSTFQ